MFMEELAILVMKALRNQKCETLFTARKDMREIVIELAFAYPEMFRERDVNAEGKRLVDKEADQARKLCDRVSLLHLEELSLLNFVLVQGKKQKGGWEAA